MTVAALAALSLAAAAAVLKPIGKCVRLHGLAAAQGHPQGEVILAAVGDIRLDGPVGELIARRGPGHPTSAIREALRADILFGNLECAVTRRGERRKKTWTFRAHPESLESLKAAGFTILSLANNHVMDFGPIGLKDTLEALKARGILFVGAGRDLREAEALRVVTSGSLRVGFLGFTSTFPRQAWAGQGKPGVAYSDFSRFPGLIRKAKARCDVLVVSFHGGAELSPEPNEVQKAFARAAVEAGADLVLGHHPHVLQALEVYRGRPILYSLGNFLFVSPSPRTRSTVVARVRLTGRGVEGIDLVAADTAWGRPAATGEEGKAMVAEALDRLGDLSRYPERFRVVTGPSLEGSGQIR